MLIVASHTIQPARFPTLDFRTPWATTLPLIDARNGPWQMPTVSLLARLCLWPALVHRSPLLRGLVHTAYRFRFVRIHQHHIFGPSSIESTRIISFLSANVTLEIVCAPARGIADFLGIAACLLGALSCKSTIHAAWIDPGEKVEAERRG